jgi:hypothetical protein
MTSQSKGIFMQNTCTASMQPVQGNGGLVQHMTFVAEVMCAGMLCCSLKQQKGTWRHRTVFKESTILKETLWHGHAAVWTTTRKQKDIGLGVLNLESKSTSATCAGFPPPNSNT